MSVHLSVSFYLSVYRSVVLCLSIVQSVYLSVCLSKWNVNQSLFIFPVCLLFYHSSVWYIDRCRSIVLSFYLSVYCSFCLSIIDCLSIVHSFCLSKGNLNQSLIIFPHLCHRELHFKSSESYPVFYNANQLSERTVLNPGCHIYSVVTHT